jgi:hypothetical protein
MSQITINLDSYTAEKFNSFVQAFGSKEMLFEKFIEYHKNKLSREIASMQVDLDTFEKQYNMSSEEFFGKFEDGQLGDENDFIIWAGVYELQKDSKEKLNMLL